MSNVAHISHGAPVRLPNVITYGENEDVQEDKFDRFSRKVIGYFSSKNARGRARNLRSILRPVHRYAAEYKDLSDTELKAKAQELRIALPRHLQKKKTKAADIAPMFALIREVASRTLGMRHYDVQIMGAYSIMKGQIAEMRTGEGKTLCATLAAATMALGGVPVHVITVNDYLAERDAELMEPLYRFLGLSVGVILEGQDESTRKAVYENAIVHGANKEIAFDYLRDRMVLRRVPGNLRRKVERISGVQADNGLRMRGLHFALIDEADSVLIDEARTPLIISGGVSKDQGQDTEIYIEAMAAAKKLEEGKDYTVIANERRIIVTDAGLDRLDDMGETSEGAFRIPVIREHAVVQALTALHLFKRDVDYIVDDDAVQIVDENTGRVQEDRSWSEGLHQMMELKEGVTLSEPRETLGRITYQRFFRRYGRVGGMTGTASDAAWELYSIYGLQVSKIPTNKPDIRKFTRDVVIDSKNKKWQRIGKRVAQLHRKGVPVLLGTRTVEASEAASAELDSLGISHVVLNARQNADEAAIIAQAGQLGSVTVATNMAGRGTDIKIQNFVQELGGLHVLLSERHDSRRVDRQLEGRCGRQGDRGQVEVFLSLDDELLSSRDARWARRFARLLLLFGPRASGFVIRRRQKKMERLHARMRFDLLEADRSLGTLLAVSGQME